MLGIQTKINELNYYSEFYNMDVDNLDYNLADLIQPYQGKARDLQVS